MINFEDPDDAPGSGEGQAGKEPPSSPFYDPLLGPWDEPSHSTFRVLEPEEDPVFRSEWGTWPAAGDETPLRREPSPLQERQTGAWYPSGYSSPYAGMEAPSVPAPRPIAGPRPGRRWSVTARELAETLLLALLIFLAVRASFQNFRVEGASMLPSLDDGEYLIVNKLAYAEIDLSVFDWLPFYDSGDDPVHHLWGAPARGDVVVFRAPTNLHKDFIKRIIGVPGDTIEINPETNQVLVNGQPIEEPYIPGTTSCPRSCGPWTVLPAHYFVMGDNRQNSSDSRQGWLVPEENIIGKALITYWHEGGPDLKLAPNHSVALGREPSTQE